ncbi:galactose-specific lectin nattectin-like isoform X2 [Triplophysa dalaica]|uniref:galactose-specific lectin nattectin-like isoform X2 n=1 Tax=Triplophysa dalaica TaxID=1582913 RepID=UPI0024DFA436|nr:galactose-specific lectin nattectin-like isoform X2 [Triplophysa dalaica]
MAVIRGLVLLFLVSSLEYAAATVACPQTSNPLIRRLPFIHTTRPQTRMTVTAAKTCTFGWNRFGAKCFRFFPQAVNWATAEKTCENNGATLASVRSKVQNDFLLSLLPGSTQAWIGGHDGEVDGQWLWVTGYPLGYTNWCFGEPNNAGRPENCLEINWTQNRCWNDAPCSATIGFICSKRLRS